MTRTALATAAAIILLASATQADSPLILPADNIIMPSNGFTHAFELQKPPSKTAAERSKNQEGYFQEAIRDQNRGGYTVILYWESDGSKTFSGDPKLAAETYARNFFGETVVAPVASSAEYLDFILNPPEPIQNHAYFGPAGLDAIWFSSNLLEGTYLDTEDLAALTADFSGSFTDDAFVRFYGGNTGADNIPGPDERRCFADVYSEVFGVETQAPCSNLIYVEEEREGNLIGVYRLEVLDDRIASSKLQIFDVHCRGDPAWVVYGAD
ncbi:MAG: hypothetical protein ABIA62_00015 [Candidatus Woesearchaeota archaeon]